jgi:2-polyprenyl-3-methyl-5-hydroxy-6-metoxy-1,4-benzoquinol methylase
MDKSPLGQIGPYVGPIRKSNSQHTDIYHRMDVPGLQERDWVWDLRGQERSYLGNYDFKGKRVLEFGAANGGLTFWMEQQGADVVAVDLSPDVSRTSWDTLTGPEDNVLEMQRVMSWRISRLNNAFWYAHTQLRSTARFVHGTAYDVPDEIGKFDVVTLCAILLHLRDPLGALENALRFTNKSVIITEPPL